MRQVEDNDKNRLTQIVVVEITLSPLMKVCPG